MGGCTAFATCQSEQGRAAYEVAITDDGAAAAAGGSTRPTREQALRHLASPEWSRFDWTNMHNTDGAPTTIRNVRLHHGFKVQGVRALPPKCRTHLPQRELGRIDGRKVLEA